MRIAILAWGSLIWDPRELSLQGEFRAGGPELPLEFSRKSLDGRLTLIIDEKNGMPPSPTYYAMSGRCTLDDAICDLQHREGTSEDKIGSHSRDRGSERLPTSRVAREAISAWLERNQTIDAVVWTNLGPSKGFEFSESAAERHLKSLKGLCKERALEYIRRPPPEIKTPLREKMIGWLTTQ
jgi:hypothetical protein